jgi:VWFA-related protein
MKFWRRSGGRDSVMNVGLVVLLLSLLAGSAGAQEAKVPIQSETTLHSQSNLVLVPTLVKDAKGHVLYGLQAKDFVIEDDGVKQKVQLDQAAEFEAVSLVLAIQRGRRASYEFARMQGLSSMLEPLFSQEKTEVAIVEFDGEVELVRDFTNDSSSIAQDLKKLESGDGGAAILDAAYYSEKLLEKTPKERRRVVLLISETRDHGSVRAKKIDDVVTLFGNGNTVVYTLAFSPSISNVLDTMRGNNANEMKAAPDILAPLIMAGQAMRTNTPKAIASMTGGEYELFKTRKGFETLMNDFDNHLHSRYLLSFEPKDPKPGLHQLRVRLKEQGNGDVLARGSYWAQGTP